MKLINDDCTKAILNPEIKVSSIDCLMVDLPYFQVVKDSFDNQWDNLPAYYFWIEKMLLYCDPLLKRNANILLFCSRQNMRRIANICDIICGWEEVRTIIWARKRNFNNTRGKALASGYEPILHFCKGGLGKPTFNNIKIKVENNRPEYKIGILKEGITLSDCWTDIPALPHNAKEKVKHPTQKPLKLMERLVSIYTNENDVVLDFCMGSGTTGVACKKLNRDFIGIESNTEYFKLAEQRINNA